MAMTKCRECGTEVSTKAKTCPKCGIANPGTDPKEVAKGCLIMIVLMAFVGGAIKACGDDEPDQEMPSPSPAPVAAPEPDPSPSPTPSKPIECRLTLGEGSTGAIPVFPTEDGLDEWTSAAVKNDEAGMSAAVIADGAFGVASGTKCSYLDVGLMQTKVRVTEGPHTGKAGWVPTEWTRGK